MALTSQQSNRAVESAVPSIQIKNVPPDVHRTLRRRAAEAGMSLQEYLLGQLTEQARQPTLEEIFERIERDETGVTGVSLDEIVQIIRDERDSR
jgi:antitoxin FitA